MAAKGIAIYAARKPKHRMVDPLLFAHRERTAPFGSLMYAARMGKTFRELREEYPDANPEDLRRAAIVAAEAVDADGMLTYMDRSGIDDAVRAARAQPELRGRMLNVLGSPSRRSYLSARVGGDAKVAALQSRLVALGKE
jgi:hypothetical protein